MTGWRRPNRGLTLILGAMVFGFALQIPALIVAVTLLALGYGVYMNLGSRFPARTFHPLLLGLLLLSIPAFLNVRHGLSPVFYFISLLATIAVAEVASRDPPVLQNALRRIYWSAAVAIVAGLYVYWGVPEPFGHFIPGSSTNGIPAYLILLQVAYSLSYYVERERLPLSSAVFTFAVAYFGEGRGSLVVAGLLLSATLFFNLCREWRRHAVPASAGLLAAVVMAAAYGPELFDYLVRTTKLSVGLLDTNRAEILSSYVRHLDGASFVLGAGYQGTVVESLYDGNPHIGFIRTHAFFGLPATLVALLSPLFVLLHRGAGLARWVFLVFTGLAVLRTLSEPVLFPTLLDVLYFACFFLLFRHVPQVRFRHVHA